MAEADNFCCPDCSQPERSRSAAPAAEHRHPACGVARLPERCLANRLSTTRRTGWKHCIPRTSTSASNFHPPNGMVPAPSVLKKRCEKTTPRHEAPVLRWHPLAPLCPRVGPLFNTLRGTHSLPARNRFVPGTLLHVPQRNRFVPGTFSHVPPHDTLPCRHLPSMCPGKTVSCRELFPMCPHETLPCPPQNAGFCGKKAIRPHPLFSVPIRFVDNAAGNCGENSPAIHRWGSQEKEDKVPAGTEEPLLPSLTGLGPFHSACPAMNRWAIVKGARMREACPEVTLQRSAAPSLSTNRIGMESPAGTLPNSGIPTAAADRGQSHG